jgi:YHS domain-containing protein
MDFRMKSLLFTALALSVFLACARTEPLSPVNVTRDGVAIKGYDPLSYFTDKRPTQGSAQFEYVWNGATWRFESAAHRNLFQTDPEKYSPKYGGYCAYAVSQGKTADIDPDAWTVFEGRLYLNLNKEVRTLWEKDMKEYIRKADENWPGVLGKKDGR